MLLRSSRVSFQALTRYTSTTTADSHHGKLMDSPPLKSIEEIPGPKGLPVVGTALDYVFQKNGLRFTKMYEAYAQRYKTYGPIFRECFGPQTVVVITDYEEYIKVMRVDGKAPRRIPLEPLLEFRLRNGLDPGMVNGNGDVWYKYRSAINQKMLKIAEVVDFMPDMDAVAKDLVKFIGEERDEKYIIQDLSPILFKWALESVSTFLLGKRVGSLCKNPEKDAIAVVDNIYGLFSNMQKLMFDLPFYKFIQTPTWKMFERHCTDVVQSGLNVLHLRLEELKTKDGSAESSKQSLISHLLQTQALTNTEISYMVVELMVGSVETTSTSLLWTLYLLSKNPEKQQKLYNEINSVLGDGCEQITPELMNEMRYLKACIKEAMRIYPTIFSTSRIIDKEVDVLGYRLPPGTHVQANIFTLFRDPKVFPEPLTYNPDRWLGDKKEEMSVVGLIWGHGARMCIGRRIAEQEMSLALARIIQKYHLFYPKRGEPEHALRTVIAPTDPLSIKFTERSCLQ